MASVTNNFIDASQGILTWCCRQALHRGYWQRWLLVCLLVKPSGFLQSLHIQPVAFGKPCREGEILIRNTLYPNISWDVVFDVFSLQFSKHPWVLSSSKKSNNMIIFSWLFQLSVTCSLLVKSQRSHWTETSWPAVHHCHGRYFPGNNRCHSFDTALIRRFICSGCPRLIVERVSSLVSASFKCQETVILSAKKVSGKVYYLRLLSHYSCLGHFCLNEQSSWKLFHYETNSYFLASKQSLWSLMHVTGGAPLIWHDWSTSL